MTPYIDRKVHQRIVESLADTRVVIVNGARQTGKSTLVHHTSQELVDVVERHLDRTSEREAARRDPDGFVRHRGLLVIDEVQRVPELILAIKAEVDETPRPGSFLLTGSARLLGMRRLPDALIGRSETIELWPFSQGEIENKPDGFVDAVFQEGDAKDFFEQITYANVDSSVDLAPSDLFSRVARGGFPEAVAREERRRGRFFEAYLNDLIDRDIVQLAEIQRRDQLRRLLILLAARAAAPIVTNRLANELGESASTIERYVGLLEEVFLIKRIPPWSNSKTSRATQQRKLMFVDSGLATFIGGYTTAKLRASPAAAGPFIENFVLGELARSLGWCEERVQLFHYRTREGSEIDAVLEAADGRIVGIEVKAAITARDEDFRHLRALQRLTPQHFHLGVLLYSGKRVLSFGPNMLAVPISALWESPSR
jgi:uncharacterized protein